MTHGRQRLHRRHQEGDRRGPDGRSAGRDHAAARPPVEARHEGRPVDEPGGRVRQGRRGPRGREEARGHDREAQPRDQRDPRGRDPGPHRGQRQARVRGPARDDLRGRGQLLRGRAVDRREDPRAAPVDARRPRPRPQGSRGPRGGAQGQPGTGDRGRARDGAAQRQHDDRAREERARGQVGRRPPEAHGGRAARAERCRGVHPQDGGLRHPPEP